MHESNKLFQTKITFKINQTSIKKYANKSNKQNVMAVAMTQYTEDHDGHREKGLSVF